METQQTEIVIFIGFGCLIMLALAMAIILFYLNYRKRMLEKEKKIQLIEQEKQVEVFRATVEAEEKQKERIANNLHDEIIPMLSITTKHMEKHIKDHKNNKLDTSGLERDIDVINQSINGIRDIALDLIPKILLHYGLIKALASYVRQLEGAGQSVDLENRTPFEDDIPFPKSDQLSIYRVCLEIMNNLYKHAGYKYLRVTIDCSDNSLLIGFMHNGRGITNEEIEVLSESSGGLGLKSLKSRLLILNAGINYAIETDVAVVDVTIPFSL